MRRNVLAIITDSHGGHKFGLMNPNVELYDETPDGQLVGYTPQSTAVQELLWLLNKRIIQCTAEIAGDDPVMLFHLGDPTHGNRHPEQVVGTRMADQILIAVANLDPWFDLPRLELVRLAAGTGSHEFGEASATLLVSTMLKDKHPKIDIKPLYHGLAHVNGCRIDYAHHGPGQSRRIWLEGNIARFYLRDLMLRDLQQGQNPPDLVLRGHVHQPISEVVNTWVNGRMIESRMIVVPPMCGLTDYARQVTRSVHQITIGGVILEIIDGKLLPPVFVTETLDIRTEEVL